MTKTELKALVNQAIARFDAIQHREWDGQRYGKSMTEMWKEAAGEGEWAEIVRVLAQGVDYYGIEW